ncbi:MAG: glycoside hydrolase [Sphingomonas bacterium]|uniref:glycoside hydrolase family 16 protein n=1 Tax=Sphingomonas bacterium TaxID=1895847 RepID=UPI002638C4AD|nr:glycoside hydrolase family 16 protein [Sphingomonas bacterium]MDB5711592.1 glycoside hydrolase [Sphingomonas bacterium]
MAHPIALAIAQALSLAATNYSVDIPMAAPAARPSWTDEFDRPRIDLKLWRFDTSRNKQGWYNNEKQYYAADRRQNARIEGGALVIEARREKLPAMPDWGGQDFSSAKLVSRQALGYGFYEVRAKMPCARGTWPAIWLLPDSGKWPDEGEIDLMEMVGWQPNLVHATLHSALFNHVKGTQRGDEKEVPTSCTEFHRYQLDWQSDAITIGIDGRGYMQVANDQPGGRGAWPFDRPYQMILNLAIGGDWGGAKGIDDSALPQRMAIDYVRYWRGGGR